MAKWVCKNGHENESIANTYPTHCIECGARYEDGGEWVDPTFRYADMVVSPVYHAYPEREPDRQYTFGPREFWLELAWRAFLRYLARH